MTTNDKELLRFTLNKEYGITLTEKEAENLYLKRRLNYATKQEKRLREQIKKLKIDRDIAQNEMEILRQKVIKLKSELEKKVKEMQNNY